MVVGGTAECPHGASTWRDSIHPWASPQHPPLRLPSPLPWASRCCRSRMQVAMAALAKPSQIGAISCLASTSTRVLLKWRQLAQAPPRRLGALVWTCQMLPRRFLVVRSGAPAVGVAMTAKPPQAPGGAWPLPACFNNELVSSMVLSFRTWPETRLQTRTRRQISKPASVNSHSSGA